MRNVIDTNVWIGQSGCEKPNGPKCRMPLHCDRPGERVFTDFMMRYDLYGFRSWSGTNTDCYIKHRLQWRKDAKG
jgi:hypothetical protein